MKAYGIGLIILLVAYAIGMYSTYLNYKWTPRVLSPTPMTVEEKQAWANDVTATALIGLITNILAIVGILIFLFEFMKHAHPHEHEVSAPSVAPPPP
jgi:beta-lactamase regulating signal transducer with metallopeptidase domain